MPGTRFLRDAQAFAKDQPGKLTAIPASEIIVSSAGAAAFENLRRRAQQFGEQRSQDFGARSSAVLSEARLLTGRSRSADRGVRLLRLGASGAGTCGDHRQDLPARRRQGRARRRLRLFDHERHDRQFHALAGHGALLRAVSHEGRSDQGRAARAASVLYRALQGLGHVRSVRALSRHQGRGAGPAQARRAGLAQGRTDRRGLRPASTPTRCRR